MTQHRYEHLVNPSGARLSDEQRRYREQLVEQEIAAAERQQARLQADKPTPPKASEHRTPTRMTMGENGELRYDDGELLAREPGAAPRTMPRTDPVRGIDGRMIRTDDTAGGSLFDSA